MRLLTLLFLTFSFVFSAEITFSSIKSDFFQTVTSPEGSQIVYKGKFFARNDNSALWIYEKPVNKLIHFKIGRVVIVEPELEQVIITSLKETPNLSTLLNKALHVKDNQYRATFDDTVYDIETKDGVPKSIKYLDKLENNVNITLSNTQTNIDIPDSRFKMDIPKYYDVINQ